MGGTITGVNGGWSERKHSSGTEQYNHWTWTCLNGQSDKKLTIITFYHPCKSTLNGECTIYLQHTRDIMASGRDTLDPRAQLLHDLGEFIATLHEDNLYNVITVRHGDEKLPSSYDQGPNCLDIMAISPLLSQKLNVAFLF